MKLVFDNAWLYNVKTTIYYKYACELEKFAEEVFVNLKNEDGLVDQSDPITKSTKTVKAKKVKAK